MINENTDNNDQNRGDEDDDDQGEATKNEYENLLNVFTRVAKFAGMARKRQSLEWCLTGKIEFFIFDTNLIEYSIYSRYG